VQYTCEKFVKAVTSKGIRLSRDGRGRALDNIFVERLWRSVKYEDIYLNDYQAVKEVRVGLENYFKFYNETDR
jgi:putative transposase